MELEACIQALDEALNTPSLQGYQRIELFTDSKYVSDNYKNAMFVWPTTQWTSRSTGRPILHAGQWKRLLSLLKRAQQVRRRVNIQWLKGKTTTHNKAADKAAKRSANNPLNKPLTTVSVRRKTTDSQVEIGSVKMLGQRMTIRTITAEWLPSPHRLFKYKYEVLSKGSKFFGKVDVIFSTETLLHRYDHVVLLNSDTANPRIVRVIEELTRGTDEALPTDAPTSR
jgi:ribonuclease HI